MTRKCDYKENGIRCNHLAIKTLKPNIIGKQFDLSKLHLCGIHHRKIRTNIAMSIQLGKSQDEILNEMYNVLNEYNDIGMPALDYEFIKSNRAGQK